MRPAAFLLLTLSVLLLTCQSVNVDQRGRIGTSLAQALGSDDLDFYHTGDEITSELKELAKDCAALNLHSSGTDPEIHYATLTNSDSGIADEEKLKVFLLFGEHARELITTETAFHMMKSFCGKTKLFSKDNRNDMLDKTNILIVYNANPLSRVLVENGETCVRENPNMVDLNRNWAAHWEKSEQNGETYPGSKPFSEHETQSLKEILGKFTPDLFATFHSGTFGVYSPYAYSNDKGNKNLDNLETVMNAVNDKHCQCEAGAAGATVGYLCPGTSLDYVYDELDIQYSFAFEIFSPSARGSDFMNANLNMYDADSEKASSFLETKSTLSSKLRSKSALKGQSCFMQSSSAVNSSCMSTFNPTDKKTFNFIVNNWSEAIHGMIQKVHDLRIQDNAATNGPTFDPY